jgi:hypothetical protein
MNATLTTFIWFRKSNKDFSYTIFPVKKNKCWKNFKIMRKFLFNYSLYPHPEIENFRVWHVPSPEPRPLEPRPPVCPRWACGRAPLPPGWERGRLAGIHRRRRLPMPKGPIARPSFFLGCLLQTEGMVVTLEIFAGSSVQKNIFNSVFKLLKLVKSLENRRTFRKMQTQFC